MFNINDFEKIDRLYFDVVFKTCYNIRIKSKNTGHFWSIYAKDLNDKYKSIEVWHQHRATDRPHLQPGFHPMSVKEAQELIKSHDKYVINVRSKQKRRSNHIFIKQHNGKEELFLIE